MLLCAVSPAPAGDPPPARRIVSLNLCTDQLALLLADRANIASVSFLAADPGLSAVARQARGLPVNHGRLEEIVAQHPDLVLAHRYAATQTVAMLRRLGYRVVEIDSPTGFGEVRRQMLEVAAQIGEPERGRAAVEDFDRRLKDLPPETGRRPLAAIYEPNGYAFGRASLADRVLEAAGFDNLAVRAGISGYSRLRLETLLLHPPDYLIVDENDGDRRSLAQQFVDHPALASRFPPATRLVVPRRYWLCGGPAIAEAAQMLADDRVRREREQRR